MKFKKLNIFLMDNLQWAILKAFNECFYSTRDFMEPLQIIFYPIIVFSLILLLSTGIFMIRRGRQNKQLNLILFGASDVLLCVSYILLAFTEFWIWINIQFVIVNVLCLVFVKMTFYQKSNRTFISLLVFILIFGFFCIFIAYSRVFGDLEMDMFWRGLDVLFSNCIIMPPFFWYAYSAYNAQKRLSSKDVEPWILGRMRILAFTAFITSFAQFSDFLRILFPTMDLTDPANPIGLYIFYYQSVIVAFSSTSQFLAWIMPLKLKNYLNRNYKPSNTLGDLKILSDEEVLRQLKEGKS